MKVRTRFAPSPTGYLHVGGVRTALFAWLVAKQARGEFLLRIEDTDRRRHVKEAEKHIIDTLNWLGLKPDEPPVRQSERLEIYRQWAQKLIDSRRAYADPYTVNDLEKLRQQSKAQKRPFLFRDFRPVKPPVWQEGRPLRFKSEPKAYKWRDEVMGDLSAGPQAIDDFIIIKSDGYPTYNFAHIIDDHLMGITHVIRSQEFLSSVPKFLNLQEALGIDFKTLATLPYVLGPDGNKKLSKRDGAKDVLDYKRQGFLSEALISFLATLGWNDGTEQEIFTIDELVNKFDLGRVQHSGARFDEQRLEWVNGHFIRQLDLNKLYELSEAFWPPEAAAAGDEHKQAVLELIQERLKHLSEIPSLTEFFFKEPDDKDVINLFENPVDKQLTKLSKADIKELLQAAYDELAASDFSQKDITSRLNSLLQKLDTKPGVLFAGIRVAVSGAPMTPQIFSTLRVLGKDTILGRLGRAISNL